MNLTTERGQDARMLIFDHDLEQKYALLLQCQSCLFYDP